MSVPNHLQNSNLPLESAFGLSSRDAEAHLAAIVESSNDAIVGLTLGGFITSWNNAAERIFGYTADEMVGRPVAAIIPPELAGEEDKILERVRRGERVVKYETTRLGKDGKRVQLSLTVSPIRNAAGEIVGASKIAHDVTEQKETSATAAQLRVAIEAAPNGMVMVDQSGLIVMVNRQMERLFGYNRTEMIGQRVEMLIPGRFRRAHPEQRDMYFHSPETRAMGHGRDLYARRKDGTEFPVEVGLNPATTSEGTYVLAAVIDITQRKRMEEELARVHEDLRRHAQTLEATVAERTKHLQQTIAELEGVSYSLSHDLRAPLRTIQGFSQIVLTDAADRLTEEEKGLLLKTISATNRLDRLIQDVLTYTRVSRQNVTLHTVDVEKLIRQIVDERPELQAPRAEIAVESPLAPVHGHEASLTQVITNILDNAVKFVQRGKTPRIVVRSEVHDDRVDLCFIDNGIGIPKEAQSRLFAIFQRVHDEKTYPGTGIGLAIVRKAVERMGGSLKLESELGKGSSFCVQLQRTKTL